MEYAVKAETHEGKVVILRRGFASEEEAEDYPIQMSLWKRVWVEPIEHVNRTTPSIAHKRPLVRCRGPTSLVLGCVCCCCWTVGAPAFAALAASK